MPGMCSDIWLCTSYLFGAYRLLHNLYTCLKTPFLSYILAEYSEFIVLLNVVLTLKCLLSR
jgi:hypothetical protein